jgi:nucleotide-binding universal stress UspA family protein
MSYKTIMVHVDDSIHAAERIRIAAALAAEHGAHLTGVAATGVSRFAAVGSSGPGSEAGSLHAKAHEMRERARAALLAFEQQAAAAGVATFESALIDDEATGALESQARYADLLVVSQTDLDLPDARTGTGLPEYLMLNTGRPVLIVPYAGTFPTVGATPLVAWDESIEASRAVSAALPILERARSVTVAVLQVSASAQSQPGQDIALFLARHGVRCEVTTQCSPIAVGPCLLSMACDLGSDLIVMGGYGHSRLREMLLGGATAAVLESMTVPVLIAH